MKTQADLYASLKRAGITKAATWQPEVGPPVAGDVRFRDRTTEVFDGALIAFDASAQFPTTTYPGIAAGGTLTITLEAGPRTYTVRELHLISEGREQRAMLSR